MRKQGYRESTIQPCIRALKAIAKRANLTDTESVKAYPGSAQVSENRKDKVADDLATFYRYRHIPFEKPRHRRIEKLPFVPQESEIDQLISSMGNRTATFLQLLKETGIRPGEAWNLGWIDIDPDRAVVNIAPEKNSRPRQLKISSQLIAMLNSLHDKDGFVFRNPNADPVRSLDDLSRNLGGGLPPNVRQSQLCDQV